MYILEWESVHYVLLTLLHMGTKGKKNGLGVNGTLVVYKLDEWFRDSEITPVSSESKENR